jgi:two-component system response regulator AgrA
VKSGSTIYNLKLNDIVFIEKQHNKAIIHTDSQSISCYETLEHFEEALKEKAFIRCHKSYLANKQFIREIRFNSMEIVFETGHHCYIGKSFRKGVEEKYSILK